MGTDGGRAAVHQLAATTTQRTRRWDRGRWQSTCGKTVCVATETRVDAPGGHRSGRRDVALMYREPAATSGPAARPRVPRAGRARAGAGAGSVFSCRNSTSSRMWRRWGARAGGVRLWEPSQRGPFSSGVRARGRVQRRIWSSLPGGVTDRWLQGTGGRLNAKQVTISGRRRHIRHPEWRDQERLGWEAEHRSGQVPGHEPHTRHR